MQSDVTVNLISSFIAIVIFTFYCPSPKGFLVRMMVRVKFLERIVMFSYTNDGSRLRLLGRLNTCYAVYTFYFECCCFWGPKATVFIQVASFGNCINMKIYFHCDRHWSEH